MSPAQDRVNGRRPEGVRLPEHSDAVVALSPAAQRMRSNPCARNQQLTRERQGEVLDAQRDELPSEIRHAATASAAIQMLNVPPQAATLSERRDGAEVTFFEAVDADGNTIVS
ncbi:hypothetical protein [Arthrobacter sp. NicSoilB8]|uniref:hypothetical protein n=1 Tax=Arthrobacter sp. NicSoilB8 TaxID=2830998 RepID=UPI001CC45769|nr:hypothetical protein [Arthrobacter sp. NicSoilB8]BCW73450.1 hypothetical protein NicSoilB8_44940 [Arthrobacter sp. NicSoilB8]